MKTKSILLKISTVLWIVWGLVHILAGVLTVNRIVAKDITAAVAGIADKVPLEEVQADYPAASGAIIGQHGFNLLWIGLVTFLCAFGVWKGKVKFHPSRCPCRRIGGCRILSFYGFGRLCQLYSGNSDDDCIGFCNSQQFLCGIPTEVGYSSKTRKYCRPIQELCALSQVL